MHYTPYMIIVDFLFNIGIVVSFTIISGALAGRIKSDMLSRFVQGLLFGFLIFISMLRPVKLGPGIFYDTRSIILTLCGLFYGWPAVLPIALTAGILRLVLGGSGLWAGLLTILISAVFSLLARWILGRLKKSPGVVSTYVVSLLIHGMILFSLLLLPPSYRTDMFLRLILPIVLFFPLGTAIAAWVLVVIQRGKTGRIEARETKLLLDTLLENSFSPIMVWNTDCVITRASHALERLTGRSQQELVGQPMRDLFPAYQRALIMELIQDSMRGNLLENVELALEGIDQELRVIRWSSATIYASDGITPVFGIAQGIDITDLKNTEQQLRVREGTWRSYVDYAPIGLAVIDRFGHILEANRKICKICGWRGEDLLGMSIVPFLAYDTTARRKRHLRHVAMNSGEQAELLVRRLDGSVVYCALTATSLSNNQVILFVDDISQRKTIEAVMRAVASSSMAGSPNIFRFLVQQLALAMKSSVALIAEIDDVSLSHAHTLAVCDHGRISDNFSFAIHASSAHATEPAAPFRSQSNEEPSYGDEANPIIPVDITLALPGTRSYWGHTLINSEGRVIGLIAVLDEQVLARDRIRNNILQTFAGRAASEIERKSTEQKYQILFNEMLEGFAIHEIICDQDGRATDYRFLAVNPAFEKLTGLKAADLIGRTVLSLLPQTEAYWIENYGKVALNGETLEFDGYSAELNRFYHTTAFQTQYKQFACIVTDITDRRIHETQMRQNLREKEILLKEVHHRVKNNLNIIASLLNLQSLHIESREAAIAAFKNSRDQIMSMALVHEELYQADDYSNVNMPSYIQRIKSNLSHIYHSEKNIQIETDIQDVSLDVNTAIPCSLILNELITNSYKYAFNGRESGVIRICMHKLDYDCVELLYCDDGVGLPPDFDPATSTSLGMTLIHLLAEQLDAKLEILKSEGLCYRLLIPVPLLSVTATDGMKGSSNG